MRGVMTAWFTTDDPVPASDLLHVDARARPSGPVVNTAVVSAAAPSYAPAGRTLVQASALLTDGPGGPAPAVADVRRHAGELLGCDASRWETVRVHEVPHALPSASVPFGRRQPVHVRDRLFVCGDHRDTPSIQGALVSGRRTAREVLGTLRRA